MVRLGSLVIGLLAVGGWFAFFCPTQLGGPAGYIFVTGTSMKPTYHTGDLVVTHRHSEYHPGDIIAYRVPKGDSGEGHLVIHRVIGGDGKDGYTTQGDNRETADPWHPVNGDVVGEAWVHVPGAGNWTNLARQPLPFGILVGLIGTGGFIGQAHRRRRRNGRWKDMKKQSSNGGHLPAPAWLIGAFAAFALLSVVLGIEAFVAWRAAPEKSSTVERLRYDQTGQFHYTATTSPSSLYPTGTVGPVSPGSGEPPKAIYAPDAPSIDLGFHYALSPALAPPPIGFHGEISAVAVVTSGENGWSKSLELLPPTPFTGITADVRLPVDLESVQETIATIEKETKFSSGTYDVTVIPTVHVTGQLGANKVDDTYAPPFRITLAKSQTILDTNLSRSETRKQEDKVMLPQHMTLLFASTTVSQARWVSSALTAVALLATLGLAAVVFLGLGRGEAARIRARYGSMVISVADSDVLAEKSQQIRLATIQDLVRLANKDSRVILHQVQGDGSDAYFVQDGALTYLYVSPAGSVHAGTAVQEA